MRCLGLALALSITVPAIEAQSPFENPTAEQYYWRKLHRQEKEREKEQERRAQELTAAVEARIPELIEQGAAFQKNLIIATDGPSVFLAPTPSILAGKRDFLLLGTTGALLVALIVVTLTRYRREAEIRVLAGKYLADGHEAASMSMPDLFVTPVSPSRDEVSLVPEAPKSTELSEPGAEFFAKAPERLASIRKSLSDCGRAFDENERQKALTVLRESVAAIRAEASGWHLRPAWQMTSALDLLLERLISKSKELTPSTLRTIASAVDVLGEVCVPGVRPDLIITPPMSILAVDDEPLCLRAVVYALEKAGLTPDVCENGEEAIARATAKAYDVIFLDIQMPGIDGIEASQRIRATEKNESTPVIFVTIRSDFQTRAESSRIGGTDFIAKPFLQFEITVKALTFAMRKRLQLAASLQKASGGYLFDREHAPLSTATAA